MKSIPSGLAAHNALDATTKASALKITRQDGQVFGFTSFAESQTISGVLYEADPGLDVTSIAHTAGLGVDNLELTRLDDGTIFTKPDVLGGVWKNAEFVLFRYNWANLTDGVEWLMAGNIGEVYLRSSTVVAEMRGLQQYLQQPIGFVSTKNCRAHFADFPAAAGPTTRCRLDVEDFTSTGAVTSVTSNQVFVDSSKVEAATY